MYTHIYEKTFTVWVIFGNSIFSEHHLLWEKMSISSNIKLVEIKGCFLCTQKTLNLLQLVVHALNISVSLSLFCLSESDIHIVKVTNNFDIFSFSAVGEGEAYILDCPYSSLCRQVCEISPKYLCFPDNLHVEYFLF